MKRRGWVRRATGAGCAVGVLLLSGCSLEGRVTFNQDGTIDADTVLSHDPAGTSDSVCDDVQTLGLDGLTSDPLGDPADRRCRITGTLQAEQLGYLTTLVGRGDGRYFIAVPGPLVEQGTQDDPLSQIDLTLAFPGPVLETTGASSIMGYSARWTDVDDVVSNGIMVVALDRPGVPPLWLAAGLTGAAGLGLGMGAVLLAVQRKWMTVPDRPDALADQAASSPDPVVAEGTSFDPSPPQPRPGQEDDPGVWARPD